MSQSGFAEALNEQIAYEFGAAQQYIAVAVYYDSETLPRLSAHFHRQALEERNHAMMMVQYLLDAGVDGHHPGRGGPRTTFADTVEPVALALEQERNVTAQIDALAGSPGSGRLCRRAVHAVVHQGAGGGGVQHVRPAEGGRAGCANPLMAEEYLAREDFPEAVDPTAPHAAGGAL